MSITFKTNIKSGFYISLYKGQITDSDLLNAYKEYYMAPEWVMLHAEFVDLSEAELSKLSSCGLHKLELYMNEALKERNIDALYSAVYAP